MFYPMDLYFLNVFSHCGTFTILYNDPAPLPFKLFADTSLSALSMFHLISEHTWYILFKFLYFPFSFYPNEMFVLLS